MVKNIWTKFLLNYVHLQALQPPSRSQTRSAHREVIFCSYCTDWTMHGFSAFPKCTRTNHMPKELCVHKSSESGFLCRSWSITPFCVSKTWFERALHSQRVKSGFQIRKGSESRSETAFRSWFNPLWTGPETDDSHAWTKSVVMILSSMGDMVASWRRKGTVNTSWSFFPSRLSCERKKHTMFDK